MGKKDRMKATDVFLANRGEFNLNKRTFAEAFPTIESGTVTVTEDGKGVQQGAETLRRDLLTCGEYIDCSNPLCHNGGFRFGEILRAIVRDGETDRVASASCQGNWKGKHCLNRFSVHVSVQYKQPA